MSRAALKKLVESSKATVLVGVIAAMAVLVYLGKLDSARFTEMLEWLVATWFGAHALERSAQHLSKKAEPAPSPEGNK